VSIVRLDPFTFILDSDLAGHPCKLSEAKISVNSENRPVFDGNLAGHNYQSNFSAATIDVHSYR